MRCSPLFPFDNEIIEEDCNLTNPSSFNREAGVLYCDVLNSLLHDKDPEKIVNNALKKVKNSQLRDRMEASRLDISKINTKFDFSDKRGWAGHAFTFATAAGVQPLTFNQVMDWTIKDNIRGDTDTNAAIAGAMVGMRIGFSNLLRDKVTTENWEILMACDTEEGEIPRPEKYSPRRIPELASEFVDLFL
jgi:ADP-ribosylglycohydrolase